LDACLVIEWNVGMADGVLERAVSGCRGRGAVGANSTLFLTEEHEIFAG